MDTKNELIEDDLAELLEIVPEYVPTIEETIKASGLHRQASTA